jgi:metal-sulfur cluster biosynthetic enzyme
MQSEMEQAARSALYEVEDPETGLSVVDLGLVYRVSFDPAQARLDVVITFTTPACPAGEMIAAGVDRRLRMVPGVDDVGVAVTFDPPWTPERISPAGRAQLGWA